MTDDSDGFAGKTGNPSGAKGTAAADDGGGAGSPGADHALAGARLADRGVAGMPLCGPSAADPPPGLPVPRADASASRTARPADENGEAVGRSLAHDSAVLHVSGEAAYGDDSVWAGMTFVAPVTSRYAHADILAVDATGALAMPGVLAVLTAADIPGKRDIGPVFPGDPLLADGRCEYHGQPLAAVVADSHDLARRAAARVRIDYREREPLLDVDEALRRQAFVVEPHRMRRGDAAAALAAAPRRLAGRLRIGGQEHFYLEGQVATAIPGEDGAMLVYSSTQNPTEMQKLIADVLALPMHQVTVENRRMGGGFGGKETQSAQTACLAALAARVTGRVTRMRLGRADDMRATGKRHAFVVDYRVGFDDDGRLLAVDAQLAADCGCSPDLSAAIVDRALFHADNCYFVAAADYRGYACRTHTVSHTAFRGFGGPQGMLAAEQIIEAVARALGKDPLDVRRLNFYGKPGSGRERTHYGQTVDDNIIDELTGELERDAGYRRRRRAVTDWNRRNPVLKKGLALTPVKFGISFTATHLNQAGALVHVYHDGSIHLNHGGTEMGQGLFIKVAQIVADAFGVPVGRVRISATRTDKVPNTSPTAASAGTDLNGMAALNAARTLRGRLAALAAERFGCAADAVRFAGGRVSGGAGDVAFEELAAAAYLARVPLSATGFYRTPKIHYDRASARGRPFFYYAYGAACSEVLVDTLTGEYRVTRADLLHDVGRSLNPAIDRGQIEGGFVQGLGWLTCEELVWDANGRLLTDGPATYKIPAAGDMPDEFNVKLAPDSVNLEDTVYRSKAVGEPPLMLAISVWSALKDAIAGAVDGDRAVDPPLDTPATPERVLRAIAAVRGDDWED